MFRRGGPLAAPDLVDVETVAVLRKRWLSGTIPIGGFGTAIADLEQLAIDRYLTLPLMRRAFELRANLTAYDGTIAALAEVLGCELLTGDSHLAHAAGPVCAICLLR